MKKLLLMTLTLLVAVGQGVRAKQVKYLVRSWDDKEKKVTSEERTVEATSLHDVAKDGEWMGLGDGWYCMDGERINIKTLNILGTDVHLILGDNTIFECYGGIKLEKGHKLSIYGQSEGGGAGLLWAHQGTSSSAKGYDNMAGIGAGKYAKVGDLVIHGGRIKAEGGQYGAGIGGGRNNGNKDKNQEGTITIYGGSIEANGGEGGAGIGGGSDGRLNSVTIYGGDIWATGGKLATGVGSGGSFDGFYPNKNGLGADGFDVKMYGGKLTAQGGYRGAGIGSGNANQEKKAHERQSGKFIIYNGEVTAKGGDYGAGIGGGCNVDGATVEISGGKVTATGGINAAGIGGGEAGNGGKLTVSGGEVRAVGTQNGAGIGGGEKHIRDSRNNSDKYADGKGGDIVITGGTVVAIAGEKCHGTWESGGSAIGAGSDINKNKNNVLGTLDIKSFMKVTAGSSESSPERVFTATERAAACHWRNFCRVEVCNHTDDGALSYTLQGDKHRKYCKYCGYQADEAHYYTDGKCACGKEGSNEPETWTVTLYQAASASSTAYGEGQEYKVVKGQQFAIPNRTVVEGLTFMGWKQGLTPAPTSYEMKDSEFGSQDSDLDAFTPTADVNLYARYRYDYSEEWTWTADHTAATLTLKQGDQVVKGNIPATVTQEEYDATETQSGYKRFTAAAAWQKSDDITYQSIDTQEIPYVYELTLQDAADNDELLEDNHSAQVTTVTLSGRTLYRDGKWNTLVLPFNVDDIEGTSLNWIGLDLRTLSASSYDEATGKLTLTFTPATRIEAGKPYIIRSEYSYNDSDIEQTDIEFRNVTINCLSNDVETEVVDFCGTYSPVELYPDMEVFYVGKDNKLIFPSQDDIVLRSFRAAFVVKDTALGKVTSAAQVVLDFGDGQTTGIEALGLDRTAPAGQYYNLAGQRVAQPAKGIYIVNGKKVVIK